MDERPGTIRGHSLPDAARLKPFETLLEKGVWQKYVSDVQTV